MEDLLIAIAVLWAPILALALVGFVMGRYCPWVIRLIAVVPFLYYGYSMVARSGHYFYQVYWFPLLCYTVGVAVGLGLRERPGKRGAGKLQRLDWIILLAVAVVFAALYRRPMV
jgi:hypothetical protein